MLLVAWRGGLPVSVRAVTAINHGLTLEETKMLSQLKGDVDGNARMERESKKSTALLLLVLRRKNYTFDSYISILLGESVDRW